MRGQLIEVIDGNLWRMPGVRRYGMEGHHLSFALAKWLLLAINGLYSFRALARAPPLLLFTVMLHRYTFKSILPIPAVPGLFPFSSYQASLSEWVVRVQPFIFPWTAQTSVMGPRERGSEIDSELDRILKQIENLARRLERIEPTLEGLTLSIQENRDSPEKLENVLEDVSRPSILERDPAGLFILAGVILIAGCFTSIVLGKAGAAGQFLTYALYSLAIGVTGRLAQLALREKIPSKALAMGRTLAEPFRTNKVLRTAFMVGITATIGVGAYHQIIKPGPYSFEIAPTDNDGRASLRVEIRLRNDPREGLLLALMNPEGGKSYERYVSLNHLRDKEETVFLKLGGVGSRYVTPRPGRYEVLVKKGVEGKLVYRKSLSFSGANLSVVQCSSAEGLLNLTVENSGDLPAYVYSIDILAKGASRELFLDRPREGVILPGERIVMLQEIGLGVRRSVLATALLRDREGNVLAKTEIPP